MDMFQEYEVSKFSLYVINIVKEMLQNHMLKITHFNICERSFKSIPKVHSQFSKWGKGEALDLFLFSSLLYFSM